MPYSLNISVFRFNSKTDFLPYYKNHKILANGDIRLVDILKLIKEQDGDFEFPESEFMSIKINMIVVPLSTKLNAILKRLGANDLIFDPLDQFNAIKDLNIDISDFKKKLQLLQPFIDSDDEKYYEKLVTYYYASPVFEFEREYFGDSFMLFAVFLIQKYPDKRDKILKIAADENYGIWLHTPIGNTMVDYNIAMNIEKSIENLKIDILKYMPNSNSTTKNFKAKR